MVLTSLRDFFLVLMHEVKLSARGEIVIFLTNQNPWILPCGTVGESVVFVFEAERDSENIDHIGVYCFLGFSEVKSLFWCKDSLY